jgi:hypothetical protein
MWAKPSGASIGSENKPGNELVQNQSMSDCLDVRALSHSIWTRPAIFDAGIELAFTDRTVGAAGGLPIDTDRIVSLAAQTLTRTDAP